MTDPIDFRPRVALASLSGQSDAVWARTALPYVGAAFLGGIAIDTPTREAARELVDRDRDEFLPADPIGFIDRQLGALADVPIQPGINVRATDTEQLARAAKVCARRGAMLEINAHCRQAEMCARGAGESLLEDTGRLLTQVDAAASSGAPISVKVRAEVPGVDLASLAPQLVAAGADAIHVDAMDSESVVADLAAVVDGLVIANNGVRDADSVHEYLEYGADAVSVGRPSDDRAVLERVCTATTAWFDARDATPEAEP